MACYGCVGGSAPDRFRALCVTLAIGRLLTRWAAKPSCPMGRPACSMMLVRSSAKRETFFALAATAVRPCIVTIPFCRHEFALDQLSLGATSSQRRWKSLWWDTRRKKHNDCVEQSGVPLFIKCLNFLNWRSPLGSANEIRCLLKIRHVVSNSCPINGCGRAWTRALESRAHDVIHRQLA